MHIFILFRYYQGRLGDGVLTGYTSRNVCRDCGYQGMPIYFDNENEYKKFLKEKSLSNKNINKNIIHIIITYPKITLVNAINPRKIDANIK